MDKETKEKPIVVGFWKRLISDILDAITLGLFGGLLAIPFKEFFYKLGENGLWLGLCITFLYTGILQSSIGKGQSLAKKALKIQVLKKDGSYLNLFESFLRYTVIAFIFYNQWVATALISVFPFLNNPAFFTFYSSLIIVLFFGTVLLVALHPLKRGLHDLIVNSIVVRKDQYSADKIAELNNPSKVKVAFVVWIVVSILVVGGLNYVVKNQNIASPALLEELVSLSKNIDKNTEFDSVGVVHNWFTGSDGVKTNGLIVRAFMLKEKFDQKDVVSAEVKKAVELARKYSNIEQCDYIHVNVRSGFNIGITHFTINQNFPHSTDGVVIDPS